jgi:hypothetical protein
MTTSLARRFRVDVSKDNQNWVPLGGITDFDPTVDPTTQDSSDYDTNGWGSKEVTLLNWSLTVKANRVLTTGMFDPGQELCRGAYDQFGDAARLYVRWYDRNGGTEAYSGRGIVGYKQSKTGVTDLEEVTVTITGDGARTTITNPAGSTTTPAITMATPSALTQGGILQLMGSGFTGATSVKFGTATASFSVVNDGLIVAVAPTVTGSQNVTVTTPNGTANAQVTVSAS